MNETQNGEKFNVLIVDDERTSLDVLNGILKDTCTVHVAKTGEAALKRAREETPDLILLDVLMPDMSGFEALVQLKESVMTRDIPVIFITGLSGAADEERGFFLGAVDYITKPFKNSIVRARVGTHLRIVKQMRTIERLGMLDPLTDLPNRRFFDDRMAIEWRRAVRERTPIGLLVMDVDDFRSYNDARGYPQGDVALQAIARLLEGALRRPTDIVARIGGDEFAGIMPGTGLAGALAVAEIVRAEVETASLDGEIALSVGAAACKPTVESSLTSFASDAERALYVAKARGKNRVFAAR